MRVALRRSCVPRLSVIRPLQVRGTSLAFSGGVATGYYLVPLQATKNLPFGLTPRHPVSDITDSRLRLCTLRRTVLKGFSEAAIARRCGNCPCRLRGRSRGLMLFRIEKAHESHSKFLRPNNSSEAFHANHGPNERPQRQSRTSMLGEIHRFVQRAACHLATPSRTSSMRVTK
jgi:hypothetical protein